MIIFVHNLSFISTHAPRAGSDLPTVILIVLNLYFNPRSPCGERPKCKLKTRFLEIFQPTLPVRGATFINRYCYISADISTHAPRAGSDGFPVFPRYHFITFQPTLPVRGATYMRAECGS